ncbi:MAG: tRNA (adenosine(37)-N6)-threonylcarbamoyltransferase complex ATPase subunit type 1 TsaE [Ignavibacteriales bacterium]|jgi:tRNA threonylcarbamoyladenosine biosynthesis protein TsaE|nr:MAG: tRNA (adenosine(37)-N6)-threonylcarbamoyltransferase complex ATPase subunit type 1 TsaE [Ignavibacteriaceae bacterium]MBW7872307.1 tRNA (adenosine(37)-N6)-threonylcarbamoyltransferase complex ATPase subunit type 1 TsaE [Ignavibacteria bacterium]MCZ2142590.1 tRNA (adenosine(37)-N6)-threonylcarbamoyltransferase complex ATPase subunit type 1 TsaE [Ignavibacteriales bacterium]MBV6445546.1 tRNA threonylcarbamoyladenosine biosynthesis protein TsaE [Ignavibacteriaceae bacterium]MBZ0196941.1 tR
MIFKAIGTWVVNSEDEMRKLAESFAGFITPGTVIAMIGNLGVGKTFFVKAFCNAVGADTTSSPTFAIVNSYLGSYPIYHFDFYRIKQADELRDVGIEEYLADESAVSFLEWADLFPEVLPKKRLNILFKEIDVSSREVIVEQLG